MLDVSASSPECCVGLSIIILLPSWRRVQRRCKKLGALPFCVWSVFIGCIPPDVPETQITAGDSSFPAVVVLLPLYQAALLPGPVPGLDLQRAALRRDVLPRSVVPELSAVPGLAVLIKRRQTSALLRPASLMDHLNEVSVLRRAAAD